MSSSKHSGSSTSPATNSHRENKGDWVCSDPQCRNVNFARRTSCNQCNQEKSESSKKKQLGIEIGKSAAEKSHGLFSADDWQCNKCGNVNWSRRHQCNVCNAPKFGEVEERTGYGGGFNDRGVVEYIERDESDDEYDEFGRKKKKFRLKKDSDDEEEEKKVEIAKPKQHDDEEDEDSEDDGDLSKYDLSGWDDDDDDKDNSTSSPASKRKRSRSPDSKPSFPHAKR